MSFESTLKQFSSIFGRNDADIGNIKIAKHELNNSEIKLKYQLKEFYTITSFDELIIEGELFLEIFPYDKLLRAQNGWRFISDTNNLTEDTTYWNKDWIVFGDRNGDAIFAEQLDAKTPIYGSIQKTRNLLLADSLESFFKILNESMIAEDEHFDFETQNEDFSPKPEFIKTILDIASKHSSKPDEFIEFFFG